MLTIVNSKIKDNVGGVSSFGSNGSTSWLLTIEDSVFENNIGGRALYSDAVSTKISNTTFSNNAINLDNGLSKAGAAYFEGGTISIDESNFVGNTADDGGAIYSAGYLTITNSAFSNNGTYTTGGQNFGSRQQEGGALYLTAATDIINSSFIDNTARHAGGAIYAKGNLVLKKVTMSNNSVSASGSDGGVLYQRMDNLFISESVFTSNSAINAGGAIMMTRPGNKTGEGVSEGTISYSQISANSAEFGGGIYTKKTLTFLHSTISNNSASDAGGGWQISGLLMLSLH